MNNIDYSLKVINNSGQTSVAGRLIKINTSRSNSFTILGSNETNMLGVIVEGGISNGQPCGVIVNGAARVYVNGVCKQGDYLRSLKSGDGGSKGTAIRVSPTDDDFLKIGIALENGSNNLVLVALNVEYVSHALTTDWTFITGTPTTLAGYGITDSTKINETEIDFGSTPVEEKDFTIINASITTASKVMVQLAYVAPTGKSLDELEFDSFDFRTVAGAGSFTLHARALEGYVADKFKIFYSYCNP